MRTRGHSYREAESNLEKLTVHRRPVNNQQNQTDHNPGAASQENLLPPVAEDCAPPAQRCSYKSMGSHPIQSKDKRSLKRFQPLSIGQRTSALTSIIDRLRAKLCTLRYWWRPGDDETYLLNAALKQEWLRIQWLPPSPMGPSIVGLSSVAWCLIANSSSAFWTGSTSLRSFRMSGEL